MDSIYMKSAIAEAEKAYAEGETPVGAVIVKDGGIIASAHNMTERLNDSTAHAELLAIQAAEKATGHRGDSIRRMGQRDGQLRLPD